MNGCLEIHDNLRSLYLPIIELPITISAYPNRGAPPCILGTCQFWNCLTLVKTGQNSITFLLNWSVNHSSPPEEGNTTQNQWDASISAELGESPLKRLSSECVRVSGNHDLHIKLGGMLCTLWAEHNAAGHALA